MSPEAGKRTSGGPARHQEGARRLAPARVLDVDPLLDDPQTRIVVCCGSGGVGKTTTAAALGLRAAERGRKVVVLTIDPARRLAQSMGIDSLDNTPRRVKGVDDSAGGELHAMMLDMKRTFDEIVEAHADADRAAAILGNPFYQSLSAGFAGTQEYMAMEKLGQLRSKDEWDLIVVDTPPSRSALDFLDAPKRLGSFLDGKLIRVLLAPAKVGGRAGMKFLNVGMSMMTGVLGKVLGGAFLKDVQTFVAAMDSMFGGFRTRADATYKLLQAPGTAFLVVAAPERDALREAAYFVQRLAAEDMPLAGLVLNRVHGSGADRLSAERALAAAENLEDPRIVDQDGGKAGVRNSPDTYGSSDSAEPTSGATPDAAPGSAPAPSPETTTSEAPTPETLTSETPRAEAASETPTPEAPGAAADTSAGTRASAPDAATARSVDALAAGLLRLHAERMHLLAREQRTRDRFTARHPEVAVTEVAALPGDVHDLAGLRDVGTRLATSLPELPEPGA
ncbi:ArsA family ATPase [Streptomyces mayonensis]|uniref:ArsA family ATPase n=1 Tax=Streptomyces mayonensis TaxID=2750816 RepID=UPI001C1E06AA|nr:ArsA family ATPase [Streptomyces sp. A108]MBU6530981.1 AAA family ATPase [Streptomyces sp. A108]